MVNFDARLHAASSRGKSLKKTDGWQQKRKQDTDGIPNQPVFFTCHTLDGNLKLLRHSCAIPFYVPATGVCLSPRTTLKRLWPLEELVAVCFLWVSSFAGRLAPMALTTWDPQFTEKEIYIFNVYSLHILLSSNSRIRGPAGSKLTISLAGLLLRRTVKVGVLIQWNLPK